MSPLHDESSTPCLAPKPLDLPLQVPHDLRYGDGGAAAAAAAVLVPGAQPRDDDEVPELPGVVDAAEVGVHHPVHGAGEPGLLHPPHELAVAAGGLPRHQLQHQHAVVEHQARAPPLNLV
jgi:hypothetical protein